MIQFDKKYFAFSIVLFLIEVIIAIFVHDNFVRPYVGDLLVVMLLYCMVRSVLNCSAWKAALFVLAFSFGLETMQYFHLVRLLGLQHSTLARTIIGDTFQWGDLVAYALGIGIVLLVELKVSKQGKKL